MKHILILLFVSLIGWSAQAQDLRIVKDNVNCTYGIKDKEGNWVVESTYILIEEYNSGYFLMRNEIGLGVFTPDGKEMIPCKYDQINLLNRNWHLKQPYHNNPVGTIESRAIFFRGIRNNRTYLINSRGDELANFGEAVRIDFDVDSTVIVYDPPTKSSTYLDTTGNIFFENLPGQLIPFGNRNATLIGENDYPSNVHSDRKNARLIDRQGKTLLSDTFDVAEIDAKDRICYRLNGLYGVSTISGDTILPPRYVRTDRSLNFSQEHWTIIDAQKRVGIMRNDGAIIIEPAYVGLGPLENKYPSELWLAVSDKSVGLINLKGDTIIPLKYDNLINAKLSKYGTAVDLKAFIANRESKQCYIVINDDTIISSQEFDKISFTNSSYKSYFIVEKNGKFGVLNEDGTMKHPIEFDAHFPPPNYYNKRHFFSKGNELTQFDFSTKELVPQKWKLLVSDKSLHFYADSNSHRTIALEMSDDGQIIVGVRENLNLQKYEHLLVVGSQSWDEATLYNLETKRKSPLKNLRLVSRIDENQFWVNTKNHHRGVIDAKGNVIIDTVYQQLQKDNNSTNYWGLKPVNGVTSKWILLDSAGRQVIPNKFDNSFHLNSGDQIASQNMKKGLIDSKNLRWKIRPNYICMIRLFGDYYYVGNEWNKKGIIRSNGEVILPVEYDSLVLLYSNCQLNGNCPNNVPIEFNWLVKKGSAEYLADQNGKLINSKSGIKKFKEKLFFGDDTTFASAYYNYQSFPALDYSPSLHFLRGLTPKQIQLKRSALWKNVVLRNEVLDTINRIWFAQATNCNQGYYVWGVTIAGNQPKPKPLLEKARKSCQCFESNRYNYGSSLVYQLRSIGSKFVTIDISYQNQDYGWDHLRSQAPLAVPNNTHVNIIEDKGRARYLTLKDIFPDDDILMQEFIEALSLRDDLKLECSSLENMLQMIGGSFSLADDGVILYLNQYNQNAYYGSSSVELLIPIENLGKLPGSKWIVPFLE
jgi:hypothetical protein